MYLTCASVLCRIQNVTEDFYKYAKVKEVGTNLNMKDDLDVVDLVFEYWKLKRKVRNVDFTNDLDFNNDNANL